MLFDCLALVIGLVAAIISKWPATRQHPFGFAKFEVIAGFINGVSLLFVSISIVCEALERLRRPPEMRTDQLLLVSTLGLLVNLVGIFAFNHGHGHGHSHNHSNSDLSDSCQSKSHSHAHQAGATLEISSPKKATQTPRVVATIRSVLYFLISISGCSTLFGFSGPAYSKPVMVPTHVHLPTIYEAKHEVVTPGLELYTSDEHKTSLSQGRDTAHNCVNSATRNIVQNSSEESTNLCRQT